MTRNVAIFFSGRLSQHFVAKENLKKTFNKYNPIIFCSLNEGADTKEFIENFIQEFDVKKECINIEKCIMPDEMYKSIRSFCNNYNNVYSMFYNNKKNYEMIKNYENKHNMKFDVILKYRTEITSNSGNDVIDIVENLEKNTVYIPDIYDWNGINDQVAYGDNESMKKYCECIDNILNLCNNGVKYHPETLLYHHLNSIGLSVRRINFSYILKVRYN